MDYTFFTCPEPQTPLTSLEGIAESARLCFPHILPYFDTHDAFLVACFSRHPLVGKLQAEINQRKAKSRAQAVTGIFEASVTTAMTIAGAVPHKKWGVISTEHSWRQWTDEAVGDFLGVAEPRKTMGRYLGCETIGVQAEELEGKDHLFLEIAVKTALKTLLQGEDVSVSGAPAIILGCAGLGLLEGAIKKCSKEVLGEECGTELVIVDGVKVGIGSLITLIRGLA